MAEPVKRVRKDGSIAWYARVKLASGEWDTVRLRAARDKTSARKLNHELQEAEDRKAKGLAPGGALFVGTFAELCDFAWKKHIALAAGAESEASRLHIHGGAKADREMLGPSPLGPMLAKLVDATVLESYFADLTANPEDGRPTGLAPRTINRIRSTFSVVFETAARLGKWVKGHNPAQETVEREADKVTIRTLTKEQILAVLEHAGDYWDGPFAVCLLAGLRRGEMLALQKADVDLAAGVILVRRTVRQSKKKGRESRGTTKGNRHDALPIHDELRPYLERWMESPGAWMFPDHDGAQRTKHQRFELRLQAAMVRAGIIEHYEYRCRRAAAGSPRRHGQTSKGCPLRVSPERGGGYQEIHPDDAVRYCPGCNMKMSVTPKAPWINFHATRHTFATAMLESGATLQGVQKLMRHSDPRLTTEIYGHLSAGFLADDLDKLDLRAAPTASERRRSRANGDEKVTSTTSVRMAPAPAAPGRVTPLRRGRAGRGGGEIAVDESSMKMASGMVEPTGIEPVTYALRMHRSTTGTVPHGSQTLALAGVFSPDGSVSASQSSARKGAVNSGSVTPVRRGSRVASQASDPERRMLEHGSAPGGEAEPETATVLLPVAEVARRLSVSLKWVRYRIDTGELPHVRVAGNHRRVSEAALAAFVERLKR